MCLYSCFSEILLRTETKPGISKDSYPQPDGVTASAYLTRGFTGHEHLDDFGLIDMNGRVYDPILSRFLSPDPYVQLPDFSQNLNRYSYCLNNPLKFTDPSGELFFWVIPNISWSQNGGLNFGLTFGVGIPGVAGAEMSVGGGAGGFNMSVGGFVGPANAYVGYSKNGGFTAGAGIGFGGLGNGFSTNITSIGVNYSSNGGLSFNYLGTQFDSYGNVSFDPSIGYSKAFYYNPKEMRQYMLAEDFPEGKGPKVDYSTENANKFIKKNFGELFGLKKLYANGTAPDGDKYKNGYILHDGDDALGVTVWKKGWGRNSDVYLAEEAFNTTEKLYITVQHEYAHVVFNYSGYGDEKYNNYQESIAYSISDKQAYQFEMYSYAKILRTRAGDFAKNVNFELNFKPDISINKSRPLW